MKLVLPPSAKNWLSVAGVIIALTALFMIIFLFIVATIIRAQAAYLGLVTYILLPAVMVVGLLLIPAGMIREIRRERQEKILPAAGWPKIDLEEPRHRHAFFIFVIGTGFFLLISAVGSYEAFHYTESTNFCGTLCHTVMEPEYVAHNNSPHAQVPCTDCHVGPGADWYVRSKLSGLYQVYAVLTHVYPRPIPTPIKNLRPARAVCEQCHWPQKFYGYKLQVQTHYLPDRDNTPWRIGLGLKVGQPQEALGLIEGIHWHINPHVRIEYSATDRARQQIPWVRSTNLDSGVVKTFVDTGHPRGRRPCRKSREPWTAWTATIGLPICTGRLCSSLMTRSLPGAFLLRCRKSRSSQLNYAPQIMHRPRPPGKRSEPGSVSSTEASTRTCQPGNPISWRKGFPASSRSSHRTSSLT